MFFLISILALHPQGRSDTNGYKIEYIVCMVFNQIRGIENA